MRSPVWVMIAVTTLMILVSCSTTPPDVEVALSYSPESPVAGEPVVVELDVHPRPFAQIGTKAVLKIGDEVYESDVVPFRKEVRLPGGDVRIEGIYEMEGRTYEASPITLSVRPLSSVYSVSLDVPERMVYGSTITARVNVSPIPEFEGWKVVVYRDGESVCEFEPKDLPGECVLKPDPGDHRVTASLVSEYGTVSSEKVVRVLDTSPPEIEDMGVLPSSPTEDEPIYFYVKFDEIESDVSVDVLIDGALRGNSNPLGNVSFVPIGDLMAGDYQVTVIAKNVSGYASYKTMDLKVLKKDSKAPEVTIYMDKYIFSSSESVVISARITDDGGVKSYRVYLDGKLLNEESGNGLSEIEKMIGLGVLRSGLHTIMVEAYDRFGRTGADKVDFFVSDSVVSVVLSVEPPDPVSGDKVLFRFALGAPLSDVESLEIMVDRDIVYSYTIEGTETLKPYVEWTAKAGKHRATIYVKTVDNRYGIDSLVFMTKDITPPEVTAMWVNGTMLSTDTYNPAIVKVGVHKVTVRVEDDGGLKKGDVLTVDVYDINGEVRFLQTIVLEQTAISEFGREATYTTVLNFPIGKYKLVPINLEDEAGNVREEGKAFYMKVIY